MRHTIFRSRPRTSAPHPLAPRRLIFDLLGAFMLALLGVGYQIAPRLAAPLAPAPAEPTAAVPAPTALPTPTSRAVAWPEPGDETGDACAPDRRVASEEVRHATIYVYCGVNSWQQAQVAKYVETAFQIMPSQLDPAAQVFLFADRDVGAQLQYDWLRIHGNPDASYDELRQGWEMAAGKAHKGAIFIFVDPRDYWSSSTAGLGEVVLHEMHHIIQFEMADSEDLVVDWLSEGGAEYFSIAQLYHRSSTAPRFMDSMLDECDYSLKDLEEQDDQIASQCRYVEGERAVALLVYNFGSLKYYNLFRGLGNGRALDAVFRDAYGMELSDFYDSFDSYRESGYRDMPSLPPE